MKTTHELKILSVFADDIYSGIKTFEVRKNDRGYQTGDLIKFNVILANEHPKKHPLNDRLYKIDYILNGWGLKRNYIVMSIKYDADIGSSLP